MGYETPSPEHAQAEQTEGPAAGLVVLLEDGREWPLVATPGEWRTLTRDKRSVESIRLDCEAGRLPCLPRPAGSGSHHRVAVAQALRQLGVSFTITAPAR